MQAWEQAICRNVFGQKHKFLPAHVPTKYCHQHPKRYLEQRNVSGVDPGQVQLHQSRTMDNPPQCSDNADLGASNLSKRVQAKNTRFFPHAFRQKTAINTRSVTLNEVTFLVLIQAKFNCIGLERWTILRKALTMQTWEQAICRNASGQNTRFCPHTLRQKIALNTRSVTLIKVTFLVLTRAKFNCTSLDKFLLPTTSRGPSGRRSLGQLTSELTETIPLSMSLVSATIRKHVLAFIAFNRDDVSMKEGQRMKIERISRATLLVADWALKVILISETHKTRLATFTNAYQKRPQPETRKRPSIDSIQSVKRKNSKHHVKGANTRSTNTKSYQTLDTKSKSQALRTYSPSCGIL